MASQDKEHPPGKGTRQNGRADDASGDSRRSEGEIPSGAGGEKSPDMESVLRPYTRRSAAAEASSKRKSKAKSGRKLSMPTLRRSKRKSKDSSADAGNLKTPLAIPSAPGAGNGGDGGGLPPGVLALPVPPKPPKPKIKKLRILFIILGLGVLGFCSAFFGLVMAVSQDLPSIENHAQFRTAKNSVVTDSQGQFIGTLSNNDNQMLLDAGQISPTMKNAVVAVEDERFYEHRGIDWRGLGRALVQDVMAGSMKQGASTITQQLVKQALEAQNDRSPLQKVREMSIAYHIEQQWTKDKILTEYLNIAYFGSGAYGIESAARTYFGAAHPSCGTDEEPCAALLTPAESALLAGIVQNPWGYDPKSFPDAAILRRDTVLQKMLGQGFITSQQYEDAKSESLPAAKDIDPPSLDSKAPYFTSWMRQQLVDRYGAGRAFFGGLKVKTTLDLDVQQATEEAIASTIGGVGPSASVVIINNKDATIDAMVGGEDYDTRPFNLATQGFRQPGSTIKPFILTTALSQGISPYTTFTSSSPMTLYGKVWLEKQQKWVKEPFEIKNYGGASLGTADLVSGTVNSDNTVYAQLGLEAIKGGPRAIAKMIHKMGVSDKVETNPAMVLGTSEVTPLQWTYAFSSLANDGRRVSGTLAPKPGDSPVAFTKVTDEEGKTIKGGDNTVMSTKVVDPEVASTVKNILHQVVTSGTGTNANIGDASQWGKTGTTDDNTNAWYCGAITEITACVWVGYPDGYVQMLTEYGGSAVDGGTFPALIWARVVEAWQNIEAERAAKREADAADAASEEDSSETTDGYESDYVAPETDYVAPETDYVAPTPEPTPAPTPTPTPAPTPTPTPTPPTGGGTGTAGGASPG